MNGSVNKKHKDYAEVIPCKCLQTLYSSKNKLIQVDYKQLRNKVVEKGAAVK